MTTMAVPSVSQQRAVDANGVRLNCLDFAVPGSSTASEPADDSRPKLLCLHGGAAHAHWFDFVVGAFSERYRVLSLDLRGHGDSEWAADANYSYLQYASDVAAVVDRLAGGPVVLLGHSMGGMVSLVCAARYPERVAALVVLDSTMQMSADRVSTLRGIGEGKGRSFASREAFIEGFKVRPAGTSAAPNVVRHMAFHACRQFEDGEWRNKFDRKVYARRHPIDGFEYWPRIKVPALLVASGKSGRVTPEVLNRVHECCPQVVLHTLAKAGHHVTLDDPMGVADGVGKFLGTL